MVKKISELYLQIRRLLMTQEDPQTAGLYARNLLCKATEKSQEKLIADWEQYVSDAVCGTVESDARRILSGEPLAYVLGEWDFYGMKLEVNPGVLIPRDDTCAVTDLAIKQAMCLEGPLRILDLCTGSGCIGLAIADKVKTARVILADISQDAIAVAKRNIKAHKLSARVCCVPADALANPTDLLGTFDMIVSNPPYITTQEMLELPESVRGFEPHMALHGGTDGLDFYRAIAENYHKILKPGGYLCFEFGMGQGDAICDILRMNGYIILERTRDYNDRERAVLAQYGRKENGYGN